MASDETLFEETQYLPAWLNALLGVMCVLPVGGGIIAAVATSHLMVVPFFLLLLFGGIILLLLRMRTTVHGDRIVVQYGWTSLVRITIPLSEVQSCRPVTYRPMREFGGWGIRRDWGGRKAYTMRGNQAAELVTPKRTILIGSAVPDQLCAAVNRLLPAPVAPR